MSNNKLYTKDSIESLSPLQFTRLRPRCICTEIQHIQHNY